MNLNSINLNNFFNYGIIIFPLLLLIGPLISEIFLIIIVFYVGFFLYKNESKLYLNKFTIFLGIFYFSTLISTLLNFSSFDWDKSGLFYFRIPLFALAIWYLLSNSKIDKKKNISFYAIFFSIIVIDSLWQFYTGKNFLGYELRLDRVSSFFDDELVLGGFLQKILPIFLIYLVLNDLINENKNYIIWLVLISFVILIIYLSGERTSFFLTTLYFVLTFLLVKTLRRFFFFLAIITVIIILVNSLFKNFNNINPADRMFFKTFHQITGYSKYVEQIEPTKILIFSEDHNQHYTLASKIIVDHFILGTGVRGFRKLCRNKTYILNNVIDGCSTHPHNFYVQIFTSNGVIGFVLILTALIYIIYQIVLCRKKINLKKNVNKYHLAELLILISILVNMWPFVPSGNFFNNWLSMAFFYPVGYYLYFNNKNAKKIS